MVRPKGQGRHQQGSSSTGPSSKNWTDMFKNKRYNNGPDFQTSGRKSDAFPSVLDDESEGKTLEPKVRWKPRSEQIQILENIFNSGMVNPPRDEIAKIRAHLQFYGQVADSNVFHWFQNRKSRSKLKNRQQNSVTRSATSRRPLLAPSSSFFDRSSSNGVRSGGILELPKNSSSGSVNQNHSISNTQNDQYVNVQPNQVQSQAPPLYYSHNQQTGATDTGVFGSVQTPGLSFEEIMGGVGSAGGSSSLMESFSRMLLGNQIIAGDSSATVAGGGQRMSTFEDEVQKTINAPLPASSYQIPSPPQVPQGVGGVRMGAPSRSRSKLKNRQQNSVTRSATSRRPLLAPSSSAFDRSSSNGVRSGGILELPKNSSSGSVNQNHSISNTQNDLYVNVQPNQVQSQAPPLYYSHNQQTGATDTGVFGSVQTSGLSFEEIMGGVGSAGGSSSLMESFSRMLLGNQIIAGDSSATVAGGGQRRSTFEDEVQKTINAPLPASSYQIPSPPQVPQGVGGVRMGAPSRSTITVFINGVQFMVSGLHPFPVQEAFGEDAVLFYQSGNPVPTNHWGVTVHPLIHNASYFLEHFPPAAAPATLPLGCMHMNR